jgi:Bacterial membrane protein YfhO
VRLRAGAHALSQRPVLAAALLYAALSLLLLAPALMPGKTISTADQLWFYAPWAASRPAHLTRPANTEVADAPVQFQPFTELTKRSLPQIPLWSPYLMGGRPLLANDQSAVFSPFNIPAYVMPLLTSLAFAAALKLFIASLGAFLLARALGMRYAGSLLAGLVYGFNLWMVTWLAYPHSSVWALLPWALLATERVVRRPGLLSVNALVLAVGLQFLAGHAESSFDILVAVVAFFVLREVQAVRGGEWERRDVARTIVAFILGLVGGAALAALVLLPFGELLLGSADIHQRAGTAVDQHLERQWLLEMFMSDYWGRPTQTPLTAFLRARAFYAGALPLLLAVVSLVVRPRAERLWIALYGFGMLAVVVGIPPLLQIVTRLPVFSGGHNGRLVILYTMSVSLLAGWGLDDLTSLRLTRRTRIAVLAVIGALLLTPVVVVAARDDIHKLSLHAITVAAALAKAPAASDPSAANVIHLAALLVWLAFAGAGFVLVALRVKGRLSAAAFGVLVIAIVTLDLFRAGMGYNPAVNQRDATQPATGAIRYLEAHRLTRFEAVREQDFAWNVIALRYHLYEAGGYDVPIIRRYDTLWRRALDPEHQSQVGHTLFDIPLLLPKVDESRLRTLRLLGVGELLQAASVQGSPQPPLSLPGMHLGYSGTDARVYVVDGALPRALVVGGQQIVSGGDAALRAVLSPTFNPRATVVSEHPLPGVPARAGRSRPLSARAAIISYQPDRVVVRARTSRPAVLLLDDTYSPGWTASVDGRPTPVNEVDYVLRGVVLPPGTHTVTFRYQPLTWRTGWIITLLTLLVMAVTTVIGWRRRAARSRGAPGRVAHAREPLARRAGVGGDRL